MTDKLKMLLKKRFRAKGFFTFNDRWLNLLVDEIIELLGNPDGSNLCYIHGLELFADGTCYVCGNHGG